jgi:hypothetical protein
MIELPDGKKTAARQVLARCVWELATRGKTQLPNGLAIGLDEDKDWLDVVKFIYSQIDGPPKQEIGLDFTRMTDAQLKTFIEAGLASIGSGDSGSPAAAAPNPAGADPGGLPGVHPQG